jgi:hypothetical protein
VPIIQLSHGTHVLPKSCGESRRSDYSVVTLKSKSNKEMRKNALFFADRPCARSVGARSIAVALLNQAIGRGYREVNAFHTESALDSLRNRPDFRLMIMDPAFPAQPFVRTP